MNLRLVPHVDVTDMLMQKTYPCRPRRRLLPTLALLPLLLPAAALVSRPAAAAPAAAADVPPASPPPPAPVTRAQTTALMRRVFDWQMAHLRPNPGAATDWVRGVLLTGVVAAYQSTKDPAYLDSATRLSEANQWKPGPQPRHADDQCIGQTYCDLYLLQPEPRDPARLAPLRAKLDHMMATPTPPQTPSRARVMQGLDWWWCDALYMAPPAWTRLSVATGDPKYREYSDATWWKTAALLYDPQEHLFFRDATYLIHPDGTGRREKNGQKIFWSRGNGWVLAGIARVLQYLPEYHASRPRYIALFRDMADRVASLQGADGLWRASLLDPQSYPDPETSGTGLFCYALAWGVNHHILDRGKFEPVVHRAWAGLAASVEPSGKLDWVQPANGQPALFKRTDCSEYGIGGFLLSGSEMLSLEKE